jgi:hypothetical protein
MGRPPPLAKPGAQKKKPSATVALSPLRETIILQAKPQRRNIPMADFAAWFRREDYERIREVMEDSDRLPPSFDEWELLAKSRVAKAKRDGIILKPVMLDPDTFVAFCKARKIRPNGEARAKFAVDRGLAESMH